MISRGALVVGRVASLKSIASPLSFGLLLAFNALRLFHHAMWRDELQAFMLAAASQTPLELFEKLKYGCEGHPGLWHLLLWVVTRFTEDPVWMQATQLVIGVAIWVLIWHASPFTIGQKLLLLLSYCFFWEYFVLSRSYGLGALLAVAYFALRSKRPEDLVTPWLLLGLLGNTSVFGAILSMGLALFLALDSRRSFRALLLGGGLYLALLALAITTLHPPAACHFGQIATSKILTGDSWPWTDALKFVLGAFVPIRTPWFFMDQEILILVKQRGLLSVIFFLTLPIAAVWTIVRDRLYAAQFATIYFGVLLFVLLFDYVGGPRHQGILFLAFVGTVWMARASTGANRRDGLLTSILLVNAIAGMTTLSSELRPYSEAQNVANWLKQNQLDQQLLIGSPSPMTSSIAGYLQRPLYYLECECFSTYVSWPKHSGIRDIDDFVERVDHALQAGNKNEALVIYSFPKKKRLDLAPVLEQQQSRPNLMFNQIARFSDAIVGTENYTIYRVQRAEPR